MIHTIKIQLLTNDEQYQELTDVIQRFNEVCSYISEVGFNTRTHRNKMKLSKKCYHTVREQYNLPAQMVVRAVGKVVEAYKTGVGSMLKFSESTSVVYDTRLVKFKWMHTVSIATFTGRIEVPFKVESYRRGYYARRVPGLADMILEDGKLYLLMVVDMPDNQNIDNIEVEQYHNHFY